MTEAVATRPPRLLAAALAAVVATTGLGAATGAAGTSWTPAVALAADAERGSAWKSAALDPALSTVGDAVHDVIVSAATGVTAAAEAVRRVGGTVETELPIVDGVEAKVPAAALRELAGTSGVTAVTKDRTARFEELAYDETTVASAFVRSTQTTAAWSKGALGAGVGIAVLDTGVSQMNDFAGRLVHGPDLSGEGTLVDSYGHGTVMAGAAAGSGADSATSTGGAHTGAAPKATVVAVKVAGRNGAVDVSTILQGMHWVAAYQSQFNIRVMNLSWGTSSTQDPKVDPLNHAVQRLWQQGIVVVVAAGNSGPGSGTITKPADDPLVISVGAYDDKANTDTGDDALTAWTSRGPTAQGLTKPDLVVPGRTIVAARSYGSLVEANNPKALVSPSYIRGSGTSQAAAITSGIVAALLSDRPSLTPDQVKHVLRSTALPISGKTQNEQGAGRVRVAGALTADPGPAQWQTPTATGLGSIEASRGGRNVWTTCPDQTTETEIKGEIDVRCEAWDPAAWTGSSWKGDSWTGDTWTGSVWTGSSWKGSSWKDSTWTGSSWKDGTWTGEAWSGNAWTGSSWAGSSWKGSSWKGSSWKGSSWKEGTWTSSEYTTAEYDDEFLTVFYGHRPRHGMHVAGETSDLPERTTGR